MRLAIRWLLCAVPLVMAGMAGCRNGTSHSAVGVIRTDNTDPSASCRITVVNGSTETHSLQLLTANGKVLLDVEVPGLANSKPPVWRMFQADISGRILSVIIDGTTNEVPVRKETAEVVIAVGSPGGTNSVMQYSVCTGWQ